MIGVTNLPLGTATYTYDISGRRVSKSIGGVTTYYLYSGGVLLCEIGSTGSLTRSYTWGRLGLNSDTTGSQSRFYLWDALGNLFFDPTGGGPEEGEGWLWHGNRELANGLDGINERINSLMKRSCLRFPILEERDQNTLRKPR